MAYIGKSIESGTFSVLDTSGNTYNGSNTAFNLGTQVGSVAQLLVSHDGVIQKPGTDYTLSSGGAAITFTTAPASGASIFIVEISGAVGGPLDSDLNGTELILDADGDTSLHASTDDQIDVKIAGADDFSFTANTFTAASGSTIAAQALTATTLTATGATSLNGGAFVFNEDSASVDFRVETNTLTHGIFSDGSTDQVAIGESAIEGRFNINGTSNDDVYIGLKSSDVAHGMTDHYQTDTFLAIQKKSGSDGGVLAVAMCEGDQAWRINGYVNNDNSTQNATGNGAFHFQASKKTGSDVTVMGVNANLMVVSNNGSTRFIVDEDGDVLHDGSASAYDSYNDAHLVRAMDLERADPATIINSKWDKFVDYNFDDLRKTGIFGHQSDEDYTAGKRPFIKMGALQRLHNGAIWQQYEKHNQLLEAVYDLAKEAVGEEKANAILDKHEVKRLN